MNRCCQGPQPGPYTRSFKEGLEDSLRIYEEHRDKTESESEIETWEKLIQLTRGAIKNLKVNMSARERNLIHQKVYRRY
ncbi:hypothetical protein ACFLZH_01995 [Patescibacteria group bacterium]